MTDCKCSMSEKLVGDGCDVCNPKKALEYARDQLDEVRAAVNGYYAALDRREHGGAAMSKAFREIEEALGMYWERGASLGPNKDLDMKFHNDYENEPIGGGNPYYRCIHCRRSDPEINGRLEGHESWCKYRQAKENGVQYKPFEDME